MSMSGSIELPKYQCHKKVWALKIVLLERKSNNMEMILFPEDKNYAPFAVTNEWLLKNFKGNDDDLGYYVVYEDGYKSWSPTKAFEEGYTKL